MKAAGYEVRLNPFGRRLTRAEILEFLVDEEVEIIVQVGGKLRARIRVPAETGEEAVRELALAEPNVARHVGDAPLRRVVFVPGRLLNLVI